MVGWDRLGSVRDGAVLIVALGIVYLPSALILAAAGSDRGYLSTAVPLGIVGTGLLVGSHRLRGIEATASERVRVALWSIAGFLLMFGLAVFMIVYPAIDIERPLVSIAIATAVGAIGGLLLGRYERRVLAQTRAIRRHNRELRRYETLFEESTNVNAILDAEGRFTYLTPSVRHVLGYEPGDLKGELAQEYMHPDDREAAMAGFFEAVEQGRTKEPVEFRFRHADGSWVVLEGRARNLMDDPEIEGIVAYTHDVTERNERELELSEYKTVAETASDVTVTVDDESVVQSVNPAIEDVFGYEREDVIGEPLTMLLPASGFDATAVPIKDSIETDGSALDWDYVELTGLHADGHEIPLAISFSEHDQQGQRLSSGIIRDITDRRVLEESLRHERDLRDRIVETSPVGIVVLAGDGTVTFLNDRAERLLGRGGAKLRRVEDIDALLAADEPEDRAVRGGPIGRVLRDEEPVYGLDCALDRSDATRQWVSLNAAVIAGADDAERSRVVLTVEDVTERKRDEERLVALNELARRLPDAGTVEDIADLAMDAADDLVSPSRGTIAFYDDELGRLTPVTRTGQGAEGPEDWALAITDHERTWQAFVDQSEVVTADVPYWTEEGSQVPVGSVMISPLGDHGVFVIAGLEPDGLSDTDRSIANMLVATTRSALDRVTREQTLRERKDALAEKNAVLKRLQRINDTIRGITTELIRASTRQEILDAVCAELATTAAYDFAWIGTVDAVTGEVTPAAWAGSGEGYLDAVSLSTDPSDAEEPTATAARTRETTFRNHLAANPPFEPWRQAALQRGYQAVIAVPITYQDTAHGVLSLYASRADVFDNVERAVLTELGESIGYALNALGRKRALVGEESIELEFRCRRGRSPLFQFVADQDCSFTFENQLQNSDGHPGIFFSISGASTEDVLAFGDRCPEIDALRLVTEQGETALYECSLGDSSLFTALPDRGGIPRTVRVDGVEGEAIVRIPSRSDVRTFLELFEDHFEECELVGRREVDEPVRTRGQFDAEVRTRLTDRQREILQAAYTSGFFDWPREITAQELADVFDISQPTVSRHIRTGERELFGFVFDGE